MVFLLHTNDKKTLLFLFLFYLSGKFLMLSIYSVGLIKPEIKWQA